ncbi:hypothetical protein RSP824_21930 [Ralstonia pseudosolanacearum]|uniref:Uncharacterized protein n=2 Tax=Ralstonia solanacearum species complex TaxID=3116862 RepID=A0AA86ILE7_RALSL|nr:hypothetical protein RSP824_21930 [Ralstonia pseudosolanacearum]RAA05106.1 hypothetical protein DOT67_25220 [Ralstonia pseudosolanacearum]RAA08186.1 hypothetical protein DOT79_23570 [Ralstonia pseudosolanacearum]
MDWTKQGGMKQFDDLLLDIYRAAREVPLAPFGSIRLSAARELPMIRNCNRYIRRKEFLPKIGHTSRPITRVAGAVNR